MAAAVVTPCLDAAHSHAAGYLVAGGGPASTGMPGLPGNDWMRDPELGRVVKIIETPTGDDAVRHDRRMLRRLRAYARARPAEVSAR